ncbi:MAG: hypothetical protein EAZ74_02020 [Alphaproteobacteria bacterium]|nr:MAG: hypothetical protein EAZ74_02020 [Alphaproteobacteria bacterium]TAF74982.1 MAG: hypothetical protein EAZ52_07570 [Alphaproteobacteria bacterium]
MNSFNQCINAAREEILNLINTANNVASNDNQKYGWSKRSGDSWGIAVSQIKHYEDVLEILATCTNVDDVWKKLLQDCFFIEAKFFNEDGSINWFRVSQEAREHEYFEHLPDILITSRIDAWYIVYQQFWD